MLEVAEPPVCMRARDIRFREDAEEERRRGLGRDGTGCAGVAVSAAPTAPATVGFGNSASRGEREKKVALRGEEKRSFVDGRFRLDNVVFAR
jgi:hypothetical protein